VGDGQQIQELQPQGEHDPPRDMPRLRCDAGRCVVGGCEGLTATFDLSCMIALSLKRTIEYFSRARRGVTLVGSIVIVPCRL
jgi:hypothetical protein